MEIFLLIAILSIVQSLFGVGLLLFGTPIMLMMGHDYFHALLYLLPASAALSWSQVKDTLHVNLDGGYRKLFFIICLPSLFFGMMFAQHFDLKWEIKLFITVMLFVSFIIRSATSFREKIQEGMRKNPSSALLFMGLVHGLSNMGGSILTPLVSSLYTDKIKILAGVSFDYAFMATFQLIVLVFMQGHEFKAHYLIGSAVSLTVRYLIGKRVFSFTSEIGYQRLINTLILASAVVLGMNL